MIALREFKKVKNGMIEIEIPDDFNSDEVEVIVMPKHNPMLESDPSFKERKEHIAQTIEAIESGKMKVYSDEIFEKEMDQFEKALISKYDS